MRELILGMPARSFITLSRTFEIVEIEGSCFSKHESPILTKKYSLKKKNLGASKHACLYLGTGRQFGGPIEIVHEFQILIFDPSSK